MQFHSRNTKSLYFSSSVEAPTILPMFPAYYIFNSLLVALLALHIVWTYLILQIAYNAIQQGEVSIFRPILKGKCKINVLQMAGDIRSSDSEISDSSESSKNSKNNGSSPKRSPKKKHAVKEKWPNNNQ